MHVPRHLKRSLLAAALGLAASASVSASPCSGPSPFTDVNAADLFCTDTEWMKNRGITTGCTATEYCPNAVVTRASIALFMQRLGTTLTPTFLVVDAVPGPINLDAPSPIIACQTNDFTVEGYPRTANITTTFAGAADAALDYQHEIYYSTNGGMTWTFSNGNINRNGTAGAHWTSSNTQYVQQLEVGTSYRWGVRLGRQASAGTGNFGSSRCFINVEVMSRTGTSSPFDSAIRSSSDH